MHHPLCASLSPAIASGTPEDFFKNSMPCSVRMHPTDAASWGRSRLPSCLGLLHEVHHDERKGHLDHSYACMQLNVWSQCWQHAFLLASAQRHAALASAQ